MITAPLTNRAYGYPTRGAARRRKPTVLAVLHQTANAKAGPMDERDYANRAGSMGPSATAYVGKDGTVVRSVDPVKYAAWSQGDVAHPDALALSHIVAGVNFNELVYESIEVCGAGTQPFSAAQFEAVAQLLAAAHKATGIPVDRAHVLAHADVNSVSRASDLARLDARGIHETGDRPGERDPAAAYHDGDRQGGRHAERDRLGARPDPGRPAGPPGERQVPRQPRARPPGRHRAREVRGTL